MPDLLETAVDALRQGAAGFASEITFDVPEDLPRIHANGDQIGHVFINLIANADQAISDSGVGGAISAGHDPVQNMVEVRVGDDGPGVSSAIRQRIFDPLFATKGVGRCTGIGLAFCHRVVTSHNGRIMLAPESSGGATFVVQLPAANPGRKDTEQASGRPGSVEPVRVLLIEDEAEVAELIREILGTEGLEVLPRRHGGSSAAGVAGRTYKLILTDLNMPGLGGCVFYQRIAQEHPDLVSRIAFVTGDTTSPSARMFVDGAQRPCLEKPLAPEELRRTARTLLATQAPGRPA